MARNCLDVVLSELKKTALDIIAAGIKSVKPENLIKKHIRYDGRHLFVKEKTYDLDSINSLFVIGFGKASAAMAFEIEKILFERISGGVVITNYGNKLACCKIKILEGSHPIPGVENLEASKELVNVCSNATENDLIICLISGGGSALFEILPEGILLADLQELNRLLILSGAEINEINTVRKQVSCVKGGKLIDLIQPAKCIGLLISDVVGDDISSIASGPLCKDETTPGDALGIIKKYNLTNQISESIKDYLQKKSIENATTPLRRFDTPNNIVENHIIGYNKIAVEAASSDADKLGLNIYKYDHSISGPVTDCAKMLADTMRDIKQTGKPVKTPACVIAGGETTVNVTGTGKGGRNQQLALEVLINLEGMTDYVFASCGSDGVDGIKEAAGGIVSDKMWPAIKAGNLLSREYLLNNDSYGFLSRIGGIIPGNPTGTNVMDIMVGIVL